MKHVFLMNPKSGGTTLIQFVACMNACQRKRDYTGYFHTTLYVPNSYATLREPCQRTESAYYHLRNAYSMHGECQPPLPSKCSNHWIHNASLERFVDMLPRVSQTWQPRHSSSFNRHLVVVKPQSTWVQNGSNILCTNKLTQHLKNLSGGCNCSNIRKNSREKKTSSAMTPSLCDKIKSIYMQDQALFEAHCR